MILLDMLTILLSLLFIATENEKYQAVKQKIRIHSQPLHKVAVLYYKWNIHLNPITFFFFKPMTVPWYLTAYYSYSIDAVNSYTLEQVMSI